MAVRSRTGRNEVMRHSRNWVVLMASRKRLEFPGKSPVATGPGEKSN
jgi:hypothetical protein